ncbi:MAG: 3-phosphoserine/phosphohydroxythreonine transaminase [Acidobacteria bacterium]|nr:3-phosphoserine/phosphohydroxythreonine transaminase [Acidobacteriota bacterium]MCW5967995.1 3-phosphoserine/phosphohydroxythreonine transaminase [Blastocatellales bacterium]
MTDRVFNFSAGPGTLPLSVLESAQRDLLNYKGAGMSVLEMSHRSAPYEKIIREAEADLRTLLSIPSNYKVIFMQGGASLQFSAVPMNLLPKGGSADYILTGVWSQSAIKEAKKFGEVRVAATTEDSNFNRIPAGEELQLDPNAAYVHFTSNNTIYGTQWRTEPEVGAAPLICDASSDFLSRPLDVSKYGLIYAGAQKNAGPAGVTIVIVREDLLERTPKGVPALMDYRLLSEKESMYNTPPCFAIYIAGLVFKWLKDEIGGLDRIAQMNEEKADLLYRAIDAAPDYFRGHAEPASRSLMNVTFRLPDEELEKQFAKESTAAGLDGLKGHRSVGGLRASIYNAFPRSGVAALVDFMHDFQKRHG